MTKYALRNALNGLLADRIYFISKKAVAVYGEYKWAEIRIWLREWEEQGFLWIVADPEWVKDEAICVGMYEFIK